MSGHSEEGDRGKRGEIAELRPSHLLVDGKAGTWDLLRSSKAVMRTIYSFLAEYDSVRLGEVNRAFRDDESLGTGVGVYGPDQLELLEAFQVLQCWKDFTDSPRYQKDSLPTIDPSWFTFEEGYDLTLVQVCTE
jgi:hypothetical protein